MSPASPRAALAVMVCGSAILTFVLGIRHGFGLFLQPLSMEHGWGREVFGLAIALQNLLWGVTQPFVGWFADRHGSARVLLAGGLMYVLGLVCMATLSSPLAFTLSAGVLIGVGMSCTTFNVVYGAMARAVPPERCSMALGIGGAAGSFGQFALLPVTLLMITAQGSFNALIVLSMIAALIVPLSFGVADRGYAAHGAEHGITVREALGEAFRHRGFWLLTLGYFTCGFQVVFIGTHFPAYLIDHGLTARDGTVALALIGLCNVIGSYAAGWLGTRYRKAWLLASLYAVRGVAIIAMLAAPLTPLTVYVFASVIGLTWLATVPLTNGVIAGIFGVRHLAMLGGIVFMSHQLGSFFGSWFGGLLYDATGSYQVAWIIAIGLSVVATLANLPIDEREVIRQSVPRTAVA